MSSFRLLASVVTLMMTVGSANVAHAQEDSVVTCFGMAVAPSKSVPTLPGSPISFGVKVACRDLAHNPKPADRTDVTTMLWRHDFDTNKDVIQDKREDSFAASDWEDTYTSECSTAPTQHQFHTEIWVVTTYGTEDKADGNSDPTLIDC